MSELLTTFKELLQFARDNEATFIKSEQFKVIREIGQTWKQAPILNMTEEEKETLKKNLEGFIK